MIRNYLRIPLLLAAGVMIILITAGCSTDSPTQPSDPATISSLDDMPSSINPKGSFKLLAPNGGEKVEVGQEYTIVWNYPIPRNITPGWSVSISLSTDGGNSFPFQIAKVTYPSFEDNWKVEGPATSRARIRIVLSDLNGKTRPLQAMSNRDFTITPGTSVIPDVQGVDFSESK
jgi:hypothetical protein